VLFFSVTGKKVKIIKMDQYYIREYQTKLGELFCTHLMYSNQITLQNHLLG